MLMPIGMFCFAVIVMLRNKCKIEYTFINSVTEEELNGNRMIFKEEAFRSSFNKHFAFPVNKKKRGGSAKRSEYTALQLFLTLVVASALVT